MHICTSVVYGVSWVDTERAVAWHNVILVKLGWSGSWWCSCRRYIVRESLISGHRRLVTWRDPVAWDRLVHNYCTLLFRRKKVEKIFSCTIIQSRFFSYFLSSEHDCSLQFTVKGPEKINFTCEWNVQFFLWWSFEIIADTMVIVTWIGAQINQKAQDMTNLAKQQYSSAGSFHSRHKKYHLECFRKVINRVLLCIFSYKYCIEFHKGSFAQKFHFVFKICSSLLGPWMR